MSRNVAQRFLQNVKNFKLSVFCTFFLWIMSAREPSVRNAEKYKSIS